jgi:hypothetical protein
VVGRGGTVKFKGTCGCSSLFDIPSSMSMGDGCDRCVDGDTAGGVVVTDGGRGMLADDTGLVGMSVFENDTGRGLEFRFGGGISGVCGLDVRAPVPVVGFEAGGDGNALAGWDIDGLASNVPKISSKSPCVCWF